MLIKTIYGMTTVGKTYFRNLYPKLLLIDTDFIWPAIYGESIWALNPKERVEIAQATVEKVVAKIFPVLCDKLITNMWSFHGLCNRKKFDVGFFIEPDLAVARFKARAQRQNQDVSVEVLEAIPQWFKPESMNKIKTLCDTIIILKENEFMNEFIDVDEKKNQLFLVQKF